MNQRVRLVVLLALVAALVGLLVHHGAVRDRHSPYPSETELATDYGSYVGERVVASGPVASVDGAANQVTIRLGGGEQAFGLTVRGVTESVSPGGNVHAYGTLRPGRAMDAETVVVVNSGPGALWYKYGVSAVGAVLVLVVFFRHWRVDRGSLAFEVRSGG